MATRRRRKSVRRRSTRRKSYRRRANPGFRIPGLGTAFPSGKALVGAFAGYAGAQALPKLLLPAQNVGAIGYVLELVSAGAVSIAAKMALGTEAGKAAMLGGALRVAYKAAAEMGVLRSIGLAGYIDPPLTGTEAIGPVPGFAGFIDASQTPQFENELALGGYQGDYDYSYLQG